jgi:hypothetical protein
MVSGKFLEVFERFDFHPAVLVKSDMYDCTGPKFGRQDFFFPARWNQNYTSALSEKETALFFVCHVGGYCMSRLSAKEAPPYFCVGVRRRGWPAALARARRRGERQRGSPARSRPPIPRARVRQQGQGKRLDGGWLKTADTAPGPPYVTGQSR